MTQYNLPFTGVQINEAIEKARVHVVGLDTAPQQGSNKVVNSDGIYTAVNAKINTSDIVTESQTIAANDVDTKVPSAAAVKDYVDNKGFTTGYTELGTASASGTASSSGFLIGLAKRGTSTNYTFSSVSITVGSITFYSTVDTQSDACLSIPIAAGETYSVTTSAGGTNPIRKIYFKALS